MRIADFMFEADDDRARQQDTKAHEASAKAGARRAVDDVAGQTILTRFSRWVALRPDAPALVDEAGSTTFAALDAWSNRIAHWLGQAALAPETRVAVMMGRSRGYLAAALGVQKAGCVYVPLDPTQPLSRRRELVRIAGAEAMIVDIANLGDLRTLQWQCPSLAHGLCLDAADPAAMVEAPSVMMSTELWDHIAAEEVDDVNAGGWKSPFTGQPMAPEAMTAFGDNARRKLAPLLGPTARVLEIGCASGFTMRRVAPLCGHYVASDISRLNAERAEAVARRLGLNHVVGRHLASHDIDLLPAGSFDLVILNSVIESFPGFGYLASVLDKAMALLRPGGALFLGNIWDLDRKEAYLADLATFARDHAGQGYHPRLDLADNFFAPRAFFRDWAAGRPEAPSLDFSAIEAPGFDPAPYDFDLVVRVDGRGEGARRHRWIAGAAALEALPATAPTVEVTPDRAAYLMFTSGTTGVPKGVVIEHRSVVNMAAAIDRSLHQPMAQGRQLAATCNFTFAFDGSMHAIYTTLLNGHALHISGEDTRRDPSALHDFLERHDIDVCDATPSLFSLLADYWHDSGRSTRVRRFILGGEVIAEAALRRFFDVPAHRDASVVNQYGPSEACVCATQYLMTAATWREHLPPPIGLPLDGIELRLTDGQGREVPDGVPGEIRIGGISVGRGYLGNPVQTAAYFQTDAEGQRWYRTGDLARRLANGQLQFLGREDRQVKIRGHRVELGELETRLTKHPLIRHAVVLARDPRGTGDRILIAYVVPRPGFDAAEVRSALEAALPAWMVPAHILTVDALPMTSNGKLDEARLPSPAEQATAVVRPLATETERRLAAIWEQVLDQPVADAEADFFLSGGHSVLAVRLLSAVEAEFAVRLPLAELFASSTVATMAQLIDGRKQAADWQPVVAVNPTGDRVPLVCFHPVGGNVLCYRELAQALGPAQPVYMVQSYGLEEGQPLLPTVEAQADAYVKALRPVLGDGPVAVAGWSFGGLLAWEAACQLHRAGVDLRAVIVLDGVAAPDPVRALLQKDEAEYLAALFDEMGLFDADTLRPMTPEQRLDFILEQNKGGHFLPDGMDRAGMRRLLALFQNNGLAAVRYRPRQLDTRLLLVRPRVITGQAPGIPGDALNGWGQLASQGVELRWMEGTHGQMLVQPWLAELATHVRLWLDPVNRRSAGPVRMPTSPIPAPGPVAFPGSR
ncbi:AMP-binding protein [Nitrospirillum sp. BR 11828]|uniref:AMP-binding protein n=1 Tax=Nitrospirillum sp. BR 11828 TaxID=3104325 RepID=UPI002ACAC899|nr:AMP-binding protein [Nitrospirillum sp. BR 11828]MDZ5645862.1 AMP-binding protein [Nitrospirillum sp. BR 11828]